MRKNVIVAVLVTFCLTATLFSILSTRSSPAGEYDPWLDYNDDGQIDMRDIGPAAAAFGASGDPTKYVHVTNWPNSTDVCVFYVEYLSADTYIVSDMYKARGFGHLHVLVAAAGVSATEGEMRVDVEGMLWNEAHTQMYTIDVYTMILSAGYLWRDFTIPVPCEDFRFYVSTDEITTGYISISFYLTWN